ncbi:XRE family transcriptional regulator [Sphingomonas sp. RRHST34]|uniref:XRE family transcriptional regulator n=1 Tax=Sphingomonas citri TaxID=2862499 RepID=A0ABS7BSS2_9SPHN|nr:XRE family transcriptional regulator [Sphingomonas citri]MBW6532626.1 XRE family transcriptional regulator [Sphingomonas citri]
MSVMPSTRHLPSTRSYRAAVRAIVTAIQRRYGLNDVNLADRLGCSAGTVRNARLEHSNLDAVTLASLEHRFGAGTLDPFLALGGSRATPLLDSLPDVDPILDVVAALHRLVEAQHADSDHGYLITPQELLAILRELRDARLALDLLITLAEPGLEAAPPATRRWFRETFAHEVGSSSVAAAPLNDDDRARSVPPDFIDRATSLSLDQLAAHYEVPDHTIKEWLRSEDEDLLRALDRKPSI